jgi:hypothetical protein
VAHLREAPATVKLVAAADKLHNARSNRVVEEFERTVRLMQELVSPGG